jgi:hypothetical protein
MTLRGSHDTYIFERSLHINPAGSGCAQEADQSIEKGRYVIGHRVLAVTSVERLLCSRVQPPLQYLFTM